jgi:hypothetical protein
MWLKSILAINSLQWRLHFVLCLAELNSFLHSAQNWPQDGKIQDLLAPLLGTTSSHWIPDYSSLDAFLPFKNLTAFYHELKQQMLQTTLDSWADDIVSYFPREQTGARRRIIERIEGVSVTLHGENNVLAQILHL